MAAGGFERARLLARAARVGLAVDGQSLGQEREPGVERGHRVAIRSDGALDEDVAPDENVAGEAGRLEGRPGLVAVQDVEHPAGAHSAAARLRLSRSSRLAVTWRTSSAYDERRITRSNCAR